MKDSGVISSGTALKSVSQPQLDYFIPSCSNPPAWLSQSQTSEDLKQSRADSSGGVTLAPCSVATDSPVAQAPTAWTAHCHQMMVPPNRTMDLCDTEKRNACSNTSGESTYECTRKSVSMPGKANRFGIIKDISVANILTTDHDKTRDFAGKDFSQIFSKYIIPVEMEIENVFEPRPPHPELSPVPTTREKCIFTQNETVSMVDPWQQMPSARDFCVAKLPRPQFRSWKEGARSYNRHCRCSAGSFCGCCGEPDPDDAPRADTTRRKSSQGLEYVSGFVTKNSNGGKDGIAPGEMAPMPECLDPADIVISSEILESLLQGAEGYDSSKCATRGYTPGDGNLVVFSDNGADEMLPLPPPPDDLVEDAAGATGASPDSPGLPFASQDADTDGDKDAVFV